MVKTNNIYVYELNGEKMILDVELTAKPIKDDEFWILFDVEVTNDAFILNAECGREIKNQASYQYTGEINTSEFFIGIFGYNV